MSAAEGNGTAGEQRLAPLDPATLIEDLPDIVLVIGPDGVIDWANTEGERRLGWSRAEWVGRNALDLVHPDDLSLTLASMATMVQREGAPGTLIDVRVLDAEGRWRYLEARGNLTGGRLLLVLRDTTDRRSLELSADDDSRFRALVHYSAAITMLLDGGSRILTVNGTVTRLLGLDPELVAGTSLVEWVVPEAVTRLQHDLDAAMTAQRRVIEPVVPHAAWRPTLVEFREVKRLDDPVVRGVILSGHDVTQLVEARVALEHLARHDMLTGLANRSTLEGHLQRRLADEALAARTALVFIDLDGFKAVNDRFGHDAGDQVLVEVAKRLVDAVRPPDLVARFGGDEFVVVANDVPSLAAAAALSDRVARSLNAVVLVGDRAVSLHASVGYALASRRTPAQLLADADASMYAAKESRRLVPPGGTVPEGLRWIVDELPSAMERGEVVVHYQPVVALPERRVVGYEGLVRWQHPDRGLLDPAAFLAVAEVAGLAPALGELVLKVAVAALARWNEGRAEPLWVSVNLSAAQLLDPELPEVLERVLTTHGVDPPQLWLEVDETLALDRAAEANETVTADRIGALERTGVRLMVDDFGTGSTSLVNLSRFPASALKIDRTVMVDLTPTDAPGGIVAAMVQLGVTLGLDVVAEGVETEEQLEALVAVGCPLAQGYLLGPPGLEGAPGR